MSLRSSLLPTIATAAATKRRSWRLTKNYPTACAYGRTLCSKRYCPLVARVQPTIRPCAASRRASCFSTCTGLFPCEWTMLPHDNVRLSLMFLGCSDLFHFSIGLLSHILTCYALYIVHTYSPRIHTPCIIHVAMMK